MRELHLPNNELGDDGLLALASFPNLQKLRHVDFSTLPLFHGPIGDKGLQALADSPNLPQLSSLAITLQVTEKVWRAFLDSPLGSRLSRLHVNFFGAEAQLLLKVLATHPNVKNLQQLILGFQGNSPEIRALLEDHFAPGVVSSVGS